jgi:xylose isomerase
MATENIYHSICRWTFHSGKGGFLPAGQRPAWDGKVLSSAGMVRLVKEKIAPRLPSHIKLGIELHYDTEVDDSTAKEVADAIVESGLALAMITPGAHSHYGYGGIASLDAREREGADALGVRTVDVTYGALRKAWAADADLAPSFVLWNGSYGYDMATIGVRQMYQNLKKSIAGLCAYEEKKGGLLSFGIEPKPNEGHPAMLLPTVASAIVLWRKLQEEFGLSLKNKGINKEFGHSEMIGLDHVYDTVEELDNKMVMHVHLNSQGYNDGIILGGPGKYDIDHGTRINGMNIAIAGLLKDGGYKRWYGHDMQVRPYDTEAQGIDRVVRSVLSWDACQVAARALNEKELLSLLERRETAQVEDMMRHAVMDANRYFDEVYRR